MNFFKKNCADKGQIICIDIHWNKIEQCNYRMKCSSYPIEEIIEKLVLLPKKSSKRKTFPAMAKHMTIVKRKHILKKLKIEQK